MLIWVFYETKPLEEACKKEIYLFDSVQIDKNIRRKIVF